MKVHLLATQDAVSPQDYTARAKVDMEVDLPEIPRVGDAVEIKGENYGVISTRWHFADQDSLQEVFVLLRDEEFVAPDAADKDPSAP